MTSHNGPLPLYLPIINGPQYGLEGVASVIYDPVNSLAYAGGRSQDLERHGLRVFPVERGTMTVGTPDVLPDHPDTLKAHPLGQWSQIACLLFDVRFPKKLYIGLEVSSTQEQFYTSLVVYDLDQFGKPTGRPRAFDTNPGRARDLNGSSRGLALHPRLNQLYVVGYSVMGVAIIELDPSGEPMAPAVVYEVGAGHKRSLGFRSDGSCLYLGRYPWTLEVCTLHVDGTPSHVSTHTISHSPGAEKHLHIVVRDEAIFCKGPDGTLSYFGLDPAGEPESGPRSTGINIQSVSTGAANDRLLVAIDRTFEDALTGATKVDGTVVQELAFDREGITNIVAQSSVLLRQLMLADEGFATLTGMPSMLSGVPAPAIAIEAKRGFIGNRIAG